MRWYVWHKTAGSTRKERLSVCLARLARDRHDILRAYLLMVAIDKGYRPPFTQGIRDGK